jgi:SAM-dependent methyltransferase
MDVSDPTTARPIAPILDAAHAFAGGVVDEGDPVVDATVGNGHDATFLARTVGRGGRVYGFDIQQAALDETRRRTADAGVECEVTLFESGHESMRSRLPEHEHGKIAVVMFNLGYLPGGDKTKTTRPSTTLPALRQSVDLIRPGGRITIVLYRGHDGGEEEAAAVRDWAETLDQAAYRALSYRFVNQIHQPPRLLVIEKRRG